MQREVAPRLLSETFEGEGLEIFYINTYKSASVQQNSPGNIAFITETPCRD